MNATGEATGANVMLAGTARSGTTLTCHLLNKLPETVALSEPMKVKLFEQLADNDAIAGAVEEFCAEQRASLHARGVAVSKQSGGKVPDNTFVSGPGGEGLRRRSVRKGEMPVSKPLGSCFTLVVKHNSAFTTVLGALTKRFPVFAVVRNPLPVVASWNSIDFNLRDGHIPAAERIDPELRARLGSIDDRLDRQIYILGWFHAQFRRHLPDEAIIRYESIVESGGRALAAITPQAEQLSEPLESRNLSDAYDRDELAQIGERLLRSDGAHWETYSRESVERLLELSLAGGA